MSNITKVVLYGLFCFLFVVAGLELLLRATDPSGLGIEFDKAHMINDVLVEDPRGYGFKEGVHTFNGWTLTADRNQNRIVPDSDVTGQPVIFIGDSVTAGWHVNDSEQWVNLVAKKLHLNATNRAVNGFNHARILNTLRLETCNCPIIYLLIANDTGGEMAFGAHYSPPLLITSLYLRPQPIRVFEDVPPSAAFYASMDEITTDPRVHILAFDGGLTQQLIERGYEITVIPEYQSRVSRIDPHPDAAGNIEIAAAVEPYIEMWAGQEYDTLSH